MRALKNEKVQNPEQSEPGKECERTEPCAHKDRTDSEAAQEKGCEEQSRLCLHLHAA
jgi:hypothetical protein